MNLSPKGIPNMISLLSNDGTMAYHDYVITNPKQNKTHNNSHWSSSIFFYITIYKNVYPIPISIHVFSIS